MEVLHRTPGFRVPQVEETKVILRILPFFVISVLGYLPIPLLLTLSVQQGSAMDTRLEETTVSPASPATLFVIPIVFQMPILVVYDRMVVPFLRRATGYVRGITHLQRVGVGFVSNAAVLAVAAAVEVKRNKAAEAGAAMSVLWLAPQFFLLGVMDVTSFVGLLEFFYREALAGMQSIGSSVFLCVLGLASWLGSFLIQVVNRATGGDGRRGGCLEGADLHRSHLDRFYWLLAVIGLVSFIVYLYCAWRYVYRHDPKKQAHENGDGKSPSSKQSAV